MGYCFSYEETAELLPVRFEAVGGHVGGVVFNGSKLTKKTNPPEVEVYEKINSAQDTDPSDEDAALRELVNFTPRYFGSREEDGQMYIDIENLLFDAPYANFVDIKMGTSTVTQQVRDRQDSNYLKKREIKDIQRSSKELGFTITGYSKKENDTGRLIEAFFKANVRKREVTKVLTKIFSDKSGQVCEEAVSEITRQLREMHDFFANRNEHEIRGASIFMVICPASRVYQAKLIDLNSVVPLK